MANNYDFLFKCIMIGDFGVGKSCLLRRFTDGRFENDYELTLGVQFGMKTIKINNYLIRMQIWDTAGQELYNAITRSYYEKSIIAFLVFDLTKRVSFENLDKWISQMKSNSHSRIKAIVIGNKSDLKNRQITTQEGYKFSERHGFGYIQTSALNEQQIQEAFTKGAKQVIEMIQSQQINPHIENVFDSTIRTLESEQAQGKIQMKFNNENKRIQSILSILGLSN